MKELFKDLLFGLSVIVVILSVFFISLQLNSISGFTVSLYSLYMLRILLPVLGVITLGKGIRKAYNYIRGLF